MTKSEADDDAAEAHDRAAPICWLCGTSDDCGGGGCGGGKTADDAVDEADEDNESKPDETDNSLLCCWACG